MYTHLFLTCFFSFKASTKLRISLFSHFIKNLKINTFFNFKYFIMLIFVFLFLILAFIKRSYLITCLDVNEECDKTRTLKFIVICKLVHKFQTVHCIFSINSLFQYIFLSRITSKREKKTDESLSLLAIDIKRLK